MVLYSLCICLFHLSVGFELPQVSLREYGGAKLRWFIHCIREFRAAKSVKTIPIRYKK